MSNDVNVELPEIEEASAQKMPVGDEQQSVAATDKASGSTKQASKRKGDLANTDEPDGKPNSKSAMINAMTSKLAGMSKETIHAMYSKMESVDVEEDGEAIALPEFSYTDELDALVESEATLSDEFKLKTAVIFETAIRTKLSTEVERLEDEYQSRLEEELDTSRSDLVEKVDSYLNYVVEQWMTENKLAVEQGLRTEIAEGFMNSLRDLFEESYIDVPESKVDLVDELADQVEELEERLNGQTANIIEMTEELQAHKRERIVRAASSDLAETQVEKLAGLVEGLEFEDEETFASKVKTVKESYFAKEVSSSEETISEDWEADTTTGTNSVMDMYLDAIKKSNK